MAEIGVLFRGVRPIRRKATILTGFKPGVVPPPAVLQSTVERLHSADKPRLLIGFVEAWHKAGQPTPIARLHQAQAFLGLCLADRAWIRLKEVLDDDTLGKTAAAVATEMFLRRGWRDQARNLLTRFLKHHSDDQELQALWTQASEDEPPPSFTVPKEGADVSELVTASETAMFLGSFIQASSMLKRAEKLDPSNKRVQDLIWALQGDFSMKPSLAEVADRHRPELAPLLEVGDETDHTEAATREELGLEPVGQGIGFPSLFRGVQKPTEVEATSANIFDDLNSNDEVTQVLSMANLQDLGQTPTSPEVTRPPGGLDPGELIHVFDDASPDLTRSEDTQILRVVHRVAEAIDEDDQVETDAGIFGPEEEDDSLVIHRHPHLHRKQGNDDSQGIVLDTESERSAAGVGGFSDENWAVNVGDDVDPPTLEVEQDQAATEITPRRLDFNEDFTDRSSSLAGKAPAPTPAPASREEQSPGKMGASGAASVLGVLFLISLTGGVLLIILLSWYLLFG